ncbi:MAG TPA: hypothetical protein VK997_01830 [Deferrisomatales bacterium]|nr:hypothetical protein [Deferrisomatales bacterium]
MPHPTLLNARSLGMGGAVRALSGPVESARVNPAGLAAQRGFFSGASYATRRHSPYDAFSLTLVDNITSPMGGALQYRRTQGTSEEREEVSLGLAMGKPGLRWGFTARYVHGRADGEAQWHEVFNGDVGFLFERPGGTKLAAVGYDLLGTSLGYLERRVACGVAQTGVGNWNLAADLVRNLDRDFGKGLDLHLGAEYQAPTSPWAARLGHMWRGDNGVDYQSLGAGYTLGRFSLGYAVQAALQDSGQLLHLISIDGSF